MNMRNKNKKTVLLIGIICAVLLFGIVGMIQVVKIVKDLPHPEQLTDFQPTQSTKIYDRTGEVLLYEIHGEQNRTILAKNDIPEIAKKAVIAIEDQGFYEHAAVDWKSFGRAIVINILKGGYSQGGSTITQQLVKNVFLTPEKTVTRKIKEWILAYWIENNYSKDEILGLYLNQIPYGSNAYGIESASRLYFGKSARELSIAQHATLAAMIQSPSYYSPWGKRVSELIKRKNYVIDQMSALGFISKEEATAAKSQELIFQPQSIGSIKAPHFSLMVKDYLVKKYGEDVVENGGLRVVTTLDWKQQEEAEKAIKKGVEQNTKLYQGKNASLVAQDPKTGQVMALVGSADYFNKEIDGNFSVATQGLRQPGSAFKPFAYITAFKKGFSTESVIFDTPTEFSSNNQCPLAPDFSTKNQLCFHPQNFNGTFLGPITLRRALAESINVVAVKILYLAGIKDTLETARSLGITTLEDESRFGLSLVLGGGEVKLSELVGAYSTFAQDGVKHDQVFILSVKDARNNKLEEYKNTGTQVIEPQYIRMLNNILSDTSARSGLLHSSLSLTQFEGYDVALKTGTTNDYKDAWVVGYAPFITVGVWAGNSDNTPMQKQGGSILAAVPIWSDFMRNIVTMYSPETFPKPESVTPQKPMLDGQYITKDPLTEKNTVHSILHFVDKGNILGPQPQNPQNDPQYLNWEFGVSSWARQNGLENMLSN